MKAGIRFSGRDHTPLGREGNRKKLKSSKTFRNKLKTGSSGASVSKGIKI